MTLHGLKDEEISLTYERDGKKHDIQFQANSESRYMLGFTYLSEGIPEITQVMLNSAMTKAGVMPGDSGIFAGASAGWNRDYSWD